MRLYAFALISACLLGAQDFREVLNRGVAAFKSGDYPQAVDLFQQAVTLHPNAVNPHLYLGTALMSQWIPGANSPENNAFARSAETEFKRALKLDPINETAIAWLASSAYNTGTIDEAMDLYTRLAAVSPRNKEAPYMMGVIAWHKWELAYEGTQASLKWKPEDPGPLPAPVRERLKAKYWSLLERGIGDLNRALLLDPDFSDAMAYMSLLVRARANLRDSKEEHLADIVAAENWGRRSFAADRPWVKLVSVQLPEGDGEPFRFLLRGGGKWELRRAIPIVRVLPVYPPLLAKRRVREGTVRFTLSLAADGAVANLQLISGHPLLVAAAQKAVGEYFQSVSLNGDPVQGHCQVDVNFVFSE